jgi:hypothetical protein
MDIEDRILLSSLCLLACIKELKTLELPFTSANEVSQELRASLVALSARKSLVEVVSGLLPVMETVCTALARVDSSYPLLSLYVRKAEMTDIRFKMIEAIADYPNQFLPISLLSQGFETPSRAATLISSEGFLSQSLVLSGVCYIGNLPDSTLHSSLRSSIKLVKEPNQVAVSEGPSTLPIARWQLAKNRDYSLRSGLMFKVGSTMLVVHIVTADKVLLKWKMNGEVYTPMTQLAAAVKHLWIIGRHPGCDLMINERTVSNNHAHIRCDAGKWYIRDLGSSNGTFQYLHTRFTLGGDSEELLVQEENRVFLDEKDISLLVSFSLS